MKYTNCHVFVEKDKEVTWDQMAVKEQKREKKEETLWCFRILWGNIPHVNTMFWSPSKCGGWKTVLIYSRNYYNPYQETFRGPPVKARWAIILSSDEEKKTCMFPLICIKQLALHLDNQRIQTLNSSYRNKDCLPLARLTASYL